MDIDIPTRDSVLHLMRSERLSNNMVADILGFTTGRYIRRFTASRNPVQMSTAGWFMLNSHICLDRFIFDLIKNSIPAAVADGRDYRCTFMVLAARMLTRSEFERVIEKCNSWVK